MTFFFIKTYKKYLTRTALIWAGCFVLFVPLYMFMLGPQNSSKKRLENRIVEQKKLYESAHRAAQEETKSLLNGHIERLRNRLGDFVIDFEDSANLTFDISQIANEKKVTSFSVKSKDNHRISAIRDCLYISESYIDISFTAGFNQFATFVNALERHRPVLFVNKFTVNRSKDDDSVYQVSLEVAAFVRKKQDSETANVPAAQVYSAKI